MLGNDCLQLMSTGNEIDGACSKNTPTHILQGCGDAEVCEKNRRSRFHAKRLDKRFSVATRIFASIFSRILPSLRKATCSVASREGTQVCFSSPL